GRAEAEQVTVDNRNSSHLRLEVRSGPFSVRPQQTPTAIPVYPGEPVVFCARGSEAQVADGCVEADLDLDAQRGSATLLLEQGAFVVGTMRWTVPAYGQGTYRAETRAELWAIDAGGRRTRVATSSPPPLSPAAPGRDQRADVAFGVAEPGEYELRLSVSHHVKPECDPVDPARLQGTPPPQVPPCRPEQLWGTDQATLR